MNNNLIDLVDVLYPKEGKPRSMSTPTPKLGMSWGRPLPKKETPPPPTKKVDKHIYSMSEYQSEEKDTSVIQDTYMLLHKER